MEKIINLVEKQSNGDGTVSLIAELCVYVDGVFSYHLSRSPFTFTDSMSDDEITQNLILGEYSIYY